jgi:Methyltransferase FkbM domain
MWYSNSVEQKIDGLATSVKTLTERSEQLLAELHYANAFARSGAFEVQRRALELLRVIEPLRVEGFQKARFGSAHDGGYVMVDDFDGVAAAFSFGIAQDANWDVAVADRGVPVYQFDHTIEAPPITRPDLIFTKAPIVATPAQGGHTIDELVRKYGKSDEPSLILKIDIEGSEWPVFDSASEDSLSRFTQIVSEFHFLKNVAVDPGWHEQALRVFKKLTHNFGVVHVHANNGHGVNLAANIMLPHIIEITFANRRRYRLGATDEIFPGPLDSPNDPHFPDIHLGRFIY